LTPHNPAGQNINIQVFNHLRAKSDIYVGCGTKVWYLSV